jgi:type I restriction enzyme S subunit
MGSGSTFLEISGSRARKIPILLAPTSEQKRIAAKVEELLARVNATKDRLAKVSMILKRFRQAVLTAACSGRLTEGWRNQNPSRESGKYLLQAILDERKCSAKKDRTEFNKFAGFDVEEFPNLPDSWVWTNVGQITKNFDGQRIPVKADDRANRRGPYHYYGASGIIDTIDDYLFNGKFLLIAEDGANLLSRSTPIAFRASGKFWVNNHAHVVQMHGEIPLQYLEVYLNGIDLQHYVTGSAQPKLTQVAMNRIPVPLPPLTEQKEIVRLVEAMFKLADTVEKRVAAAIARAEKLTQAILAKAFSGELVPTEAELARLEGRPYETASELLARIKSERDAKQTSQKVRRNRN